MSDADLTLVALYDWTLRAEQELEDLKSCFPEVLRADQNRLVMSFRCLRISLELRVTRPVKKEAGAPSRGAGLWADSLGTTRSD